MSIFDLVLVIMLIALAAGAAYGIARVTGKQPYHHLVDYLLVFCFTAGIVAAAVTVDRNASLPQETHPSIEALWVVTGGILRFVILLAVFIFPVAITRIIKLVISLRQNGGNSAFGCKTR